MWRKLTPAYATLIKTMWNHERHFTGALKGSLEHGNVEVLEEAMTSDTEYGLRTSVRGATTATNDAAASRSFLIDDPGPWSPYYYVWCPIPDGSGTLQRARRYIRCKN